MWKSVVLRSLLVLALVMVIAVAATIMLASTIDLTHYKEELADGISQATGRTLKIDGELSVKISLLPTVVASNVHFGNVSWGSRPDMARAELIEAQFSLLALLHGQVELVRIVLKGADVLIETNRRGIGNWEMSLLEDLSLVQEAPEAEPIIVSFDPDMDVFIENSTLTYKDGQSKQQEIVHLRRASIESASSDKPLEVSLDGGWNKVDYRINGEIGTIFALRNATEPELIDVNVRALGVTAHIKGQVADLLSAKGIDVAVDAKAADLDELRTQFGDVVPLGGPVTLSMTVSGELTDLELTNIQGKLGPSTVSGRLTINTQGRRPMVRGELALDDYDLTARSVAGTDKQIDKPKAEQRIFSEEPLTLERLKLYDAELTLKGKNITFPVVHARELSADVTIKAGKMVMSIDRIATADSEVNIEFTIDVNRAVPSMGVRLRSSDMNIGKLLENTKAAGAIDGNLAIDIDLQGQGRSLAEIARTFTGHIRLLMDQATVKGRSLDKVAGGTRAIFDTMFTKKSDSTVINCAISNLTVEKGIATPEVFLMDTRYSTLVADGYADLGLEILDIKVTPASKGVSLNLAVPVRIYGSLRSPDYTIVKTGTIYKVGELLSVLVYPPAAVVVFTDLGSGRDNPCVTLVAPKERLPKRAIKGTGRVIKRVITSPIRGLKKLRGSGANENANDETELTVD